MKQGDRLYQETMLRVGRGGMRGIDSLLESGHTGIAEKHTVLKMITYVRELEQELGINIPKATEVQTEGTIKVRDGNMEYWV